jgi:hypothetical protein
VVDDLAALHSGRQRLGVEDIAADGLRPRLGERARGAFGPGECPERTPVGEEALDDRRAENTGAPRDEDRQLVPLQVMLTHFWFASTKPECALRRAKAGQPW